MWGVRHLSVRALLALQFAKDDFTNSAGPDLPSQAALDHSRSRDLLRCLVGAVLQKNPRVPVLDECRAASWHTRAAAVHATAAPTMMEPLGNPAGLGDETTTDQAVLPGAPSGQLETLTRAEPAMALLEGVGEDTSSFAASLSSASDDALPVVGEVAGHGAEVPLVTPQCSPATLAGTTWAVACCPVTVGRTIFETTGLTLAARGSDGVVASVTPTGGHLDGTAADLVVSGAVAARAVDLAPQDSPLLIAPVEGADDDVRAFLCLRYAEFRAVASTACRGRRSYRSKVAANLTHDVDSGWSCIASTIFGAPAACAGALELRSIALEGRATDLARTGRPGSKPFGFFAIRRAKRSAVCSGGWCNPSRVAARSANDLDSARKRNSRVGCRDHAWSVRVRHLSVNPCDRSE
jgi:hypothetical protein